MMINYNDLYLQMLCESKDNQKESVLERVEKLGLHLGKEEVELEGKHLMRCVMKKWLPAAEAMLGMIVNHLPSPDVAQRYRTEMLYEGPLDDPAATGIRRKHRTSCTLL